jgi:glycosyltransferase involved in cell wall biosynthesis
VKILHVIPSVSERSGGPAQAIFPMCRALQAKGVEVVLITTDADLELNERLPAQINYKRVPTMFFSSQLGFSFKYSRQMAYWLSDNVAQFDLVHIHAVFNHACMSAASACRKHAVPYVVRPLGTLDPWSMQQKRLKKGLFWIAIGRSMLRNSAMVHYTSEAEKLRTESSLNLVRGNVVPLGIDFSTSDLDKRVSLSDLPERRKPYVLVMSRLDPKKGIPPLIKSFLSLRREERFSNWQLVIAGDGAPEYLDFLRKIVRQFNGTDDAVQFTGWLSGAQKISYLQNAELLALTSYQENFGICVMEAMACGVPVLTSSHVDLSSEILRANAGWVVEVDESSIGKALAEALSSAEQRKYRGKNGLEVARAFTWDRIGAELIDMYSAISAK